MKFLGLKMLPAGVHYVHYSTVGSNNDVSPRRGFFISVDPGEVIVHRFDVEREEIVNDVTEEEVERFKSNLKNIDSHLGAYPHKLWSKWVSLSNRISPTSLDKYQQFESSESTFAKYDFTEVPKQKYPDGSSASEISLHNLDSSHQLQVFLQGEESVEEVLVQLQMAFILFLVGQDYESFNQWKVVVDMMCGCGNALVKYPNLFKRFINDLHFQVLIIKIN